MAQRPKYGAKKTTVDGLRFDSRKEAARYLELKMLERAGVISGLRTQVPFVIAPPVKIVGESRARPALRYIADFVYEQDGAVVVEDTKGVHTDAYRIKKHLMKSVHNIDVKDRA